MSIAVAQIFIFPAKYNIFMAKRAGMPRQFFASMPVSYTHLDVYKRPGNMKNEFNVKGHPIATDAAGWPFL